MQSNQLVRDYKLMASLQTIIKARRVHYTQLFIAKEGSGLLAFARGKKLGLPDDDCFYKNRRREKVSKAFNEFNYHAISTEIIDAFRKRTHKWCKTNYKPLTAQQRDIVYLYHEDILLSPLQELKENNPEWGTNLQIINNIKKSSKTDLAGDYNSNAKVQIEKYTHQVSKEQYDSVQETLNRYPIKTNSDYPKKK